MKFCLFISSVQKEFARERREIARYVRKDALFGKFFDVFLFEETPAGSGPATPVLWTRNLRGLRPGDFAGADPKRPRPWSDRLAPEELPFGDRLVVLVRRDGRAETIRARDLTDASFLGGATNDPAMLEVLEALADPATRSPDAGEPHAESAE